MSSVALLFEVGLATLMVVLIVYCIKLNKRLTLIRNQNAEFADMMTGLADASNRAEQAAHQLKAVGVSAERSLRTAIEDAAIAQAELTRLAETAPNATAPAATRQQQAGSDQSSPSAADHPVEPRREKIHRDMLIGDTVATPGKQDLPQAERPKTRAEAEETVLQAIRSARVGT